ncbi:MAG: hypothetical protein QG615_943, partial [Nitrospirota bacterium]|nr:hypothetical protein [Nitrospirota bacterium]
MQRELGNLVNLVAALEQPADGLMPQIMKTQILNSQKTTGSRECGANAFSVIGKNAVACFGL